MEKHSGLASRQGTAHASLAAPSVLWPTAAQLCLRRRPSCFSPRSRRASIGSTRHHCKVRKSALRRPVWIAIISAGYRLLLRELRAAARGRASSSREIAPPHVTARAERLHIGLNGSPKPMLAQNGAQRSHFHVDGGCGSALAFARCLVSRDLIDINVRE
jgi:hypothetical protein